MAVGAVGHAQPYCVSGRVLDAQTREPMEFATVAHLTTRQGTVVAADGTFMLRNLPRGTARLEVRLFGYVPELLTFTLSHDTTGLVVLLHEQNLKLDEVTVTSRKQHIETTAYTVDRTSLDHNQVISVSDITSLLPGGKSQGDLSLIDDPRIALRSEGTSEMGNAAFGTAIEVDGQRLSNNAEMGETTGTSTRNVTTSDIEEVEVITGIPSVEYGDLSNGMVRVKTRRGKTPLMVDVTLKPHTKLAALGKGFNLGHSGEGGILNVSYEWSQSISSLTSPYTTYQRNGLALRYTRQFCKERAMPLNLNVDLKGNLGGYSNEADPDAFSDTYVKQHDYALRGLMRLQWQVGRPWLSWIELSADMSLENKERSENVNRSSATSQPALHVTEQGYHIAGSTSSDQITMGPVGYWYELAITDSRPVDYGVHLKAKWDHEMVLGSRCTMHDAGRSVHDAVRSVHDARCTMESHAKAGVDYTASGNEGRGLYYDDLALAPTWREARYDTLPYMHNLALYAEEQLVLHLPRRQELKASFGLREDMTHISGSAYGTVGSLSPRGSVQYTLGSFSLHAGMGRSVKLPSMQVLYPATSYTDWQTFASGTDYQGKACYAYYTQPSSALYNADLRWQYSLQSEVGAEWRLGGTRFSLTYFHTTTRRPYLRTSVYEPFSYALTSPITDPDFPIAATDRQYACLPESGAIVVSDASGQSDPVTLPSQTIRRYTSNTRWINGSPSTRQGIEWVVDFARIPALRTDIRWDGTFYHYRGVETSLIASRLGDSQQQSDGQPYSYVGYYEGAAAAANGSVQSQLNTNVTLTTHIPVVRLILSMRFECTLLDCKQQLRDGQVDDNGYATVYPKYYSTWDDPTTLRPFYDDLVTAREEGNTALYNDLLRMVKRATTTYYFREDRLSPYFATNVNVTKEIGNHVQLSFYATNFWNNTSRIHSSQTDRSTTLYGSSHIPAFYYGLALKVKL